MSRWRLLLQVVLKLILRRRPAFWHLISELEGCDFDSEEAAFWLLISELEGCNLRVQSEFGAIPDAADSTALSLVEVDADLSLLVVTYCDYAPAVAIEQCVLLPAPFPMRRPHRIPSRLRAGGAQ